MMALVLLGLTTDGARSNPLFCGDEGLDSIMNLTGCGTVFHEIRSLSPEKKEKLEVGVQQSIQPEVGVSSEPPPNASVLRINPGVYESSEPEPESANTSPKNQVEGTSRSDADIPEVINNAFSSDGDSVYLNLDEDGTYIFLGEPEREDGTTEDYSLEDQSQVPNQIGFGKKWRF